MSFKIIFPLLVVAPFCGFSASIAAEPVVHLVALAGCHRQDGPAPAMFRYVDARPDLMIWLGDNVYADTKDDITFIEKCYGLLAAQPAFAQLPTR